MGDQWGLKFIKNDFISTCNHGFSQIS